MPDRSGGDACIKRCEENSEHVARLVVSLLGAPGGDLVTSSQHNTTQRDQRSLVGLGDGAPESPAKRIHGGWIFYQQSATTRRVRRLGRQAGSGLRHRINSLGL